MVRIPVMNSYRYLAEDDRGWFTTKQERGQRFASEIDAFRAKKDALRIFPDAGYEVVCTTKLLVFGSRKWLAMKNIERELIKYPPGTTVIHGAAPGADNIGGDVARQLGFVVRSYPAPWKTMGKGAGPIRNQQMLDEEHPHKDGSFFDRALCFHEDPNLGTGSADMRRRLEKASPFIPIEIFRP